MFRYSYQLEEEKAHMKRAIIRSPKRLDPELKTVLKVVRNYP